MNHSPSISLYMLLFTINLIIKHQPSTSHQSLLPINHQILMINDPDVVWCVTGFVSIGFRLSWTLRNDKDALVSRLEVASRFEWWFQTWGRHGAAAGDKRRSPARCCQEDQRKWWAVTIYCAYWIQGMGRSYKASYIFGIFLAASWGIRNGWSCAGVTAISGHLWDLKQLLQLVLLDDWL